MQSYMAANQHELQQKRPQGKKMVHQPAQHSANFSSFIGYGGPVRREDAETALQLGTTKASNFMTNCW